MSETFEIFETYSHWLFLFFLFSVIGWLMESIIESVSHRRLINRGSLSGPYIPIYGLGGVLFALVGTPLKTAYADPYFNFFLVYFIGMLVATALEYAVGSFLERVFKKQFWDYSELKLTNKFTYKNRISLVSSLFFGLCSLFMTYVLYDIVSTFAVTLNFYLLIIVNVVMTLLMGTDIMIQIRRQERFQTLMEKLSHEQLRETLLNNLRRMGKKGQFIEFRDSMFKNIKNINENIKNNIENIKRK